MMTNSKVLLVLIITITATVTLYWFSSYDTEVSFVQPNTVVESESDNARPSKSETILPLAMDEASQAAKDEQLVSAAQEVAKVEKASQAKRFLPKKATPVSLSAQELSILKEKSQRKQAEINLLIAQYGENINDRGKTQDLQAQVKVLMAEYNEMILPLALNSMAERNNG